MTKPDAANTIEIESFRGLQTNVDPSDADDGGAIVQENLAMVAPGMLQVRGGMREVQFEE